MVSEEEDLPYLRAFCNSLPNVSSMTRHVSFICRLACYVIAPSPSQYMSWQEMKLLPNSMLPRLSRSCHTCYIPWGSHLGPSPLLPSVRLIVGNWYIYAAFRPLQPLSSGPGSLRVSHL